MFNKQEISIAVCGNPRVGKSTLRDRFLKRKDIRVDEESFPLMYEQRDKLQGSWLVDVIEGPSNSESFVKPSDAYVLIFDPNNYQSFADLESHVLSIKKNAPAHSKLFLVANTRTGADTNVEQSEINIFCQRHNIGNMSDEFFIIDASSQQSTAEMVIEKILDRAMLAKTSVTPAASSSSSSSSLSSSSYQGQSWTTPVAGSSGYVSSSAHRPYNRPGNTSFNWKVLAAISGVLLVASLVALSLGTCGIGTAAVALGLTIGGAIGTGLMAPAFGYSVFRCRKQTQEDRSDRSLSAIPTH